MYTPPSDSSQEPEHVARYLSEPLAAAWTAFDLGKGAADEFFASEDRREHDPHVWAQIARYEARLSLVEASLSAEWKLSTFDNCGMQIYLDPFTVRVLKAYDGGPPHPGRSRIRRAFFQQLQLRLPLFGMDAGSNLILYWKVGGHSGLQLGLCKPRGLWRFKGQPKLEWRQPVSYDPLAGLQFDAVEDDDLDVGLRFDEDDLGEEEAGE